MRKSKDMCAGCEDDFYNGKNSYGIKECWSYKNAEIKLRKAVPIHQCPPWNQKGQKMLSCYHRKFYVYVDGDRTQ